MDLETAAILTRTDPDVIRRAVRNGLAKPLPSTDPGAPLRFAEEEIAAWINPARFHELLSARLKRGADAAFLGDFPCPRTYRQKNRFTLPFRGRWLVFDGGDLRTADGRIRNSHFYCEPCFRWASDFIVIHPDDYPKTRVGQTHNEALSLRRRTGQPEGIADVACSEPENDPMNSYWNILNPDGLDPRRNYLYEVEIIAPADGVFMTRRGKTDDPSFAAEVERLALAGADDEMGFLLDHGNSEISQIAHVLGRTIAARPGEHVKRGQVLCKAGGRHAGLPHLHWAVRDSWSDYLASGLPIRIAACSVYDEPRQTPAPPAPNHNAAAREIAPRTDVTLQRGMIVDNI